MKLEIGNQGKRIEGFYNLDVIPGENVDYVVNAAGELPFEDNSIEIIYASHILEHIPWYQVEDTLKEWFRILKINGCLEIWVPDGYKICKAIVDIEEGNMIEIKDNWRKFNQEFNIYKWASGRLFTYGDEKGEINHPNWHRSLFTYKYLKELFIIVGLKNIEKMEEKNVRGVKHGWINLGVKGYKL
jgi:predicted SAM-dependent methyltransferase